jgi:hypothetical protein
MDCVLTSALLLLLVICDALITDQALTPVSTTTSVPTPLLARSHNTSCGSQTIRETSAQKLSETLAPPSMTHSVPSVCERKRRGDTVLSLNACAAVHARRGTYKPHNALSQPLIGAALACCAAPATRRAAPAPHPHVLPRITSTCAAHHRLHCSGVPYTRHRRHLQGAALEARRSGWRAGGQRGPAGALWALDIRVVCAQQLTRLLPCPRVDHPIPSGV